MKRRVRGETALSTELLAWQGAGCHCEECNDEAICLCRLEIATGFRPRNDTALGR